MTRLIWSPRSVRDLESIQEHIAQDSPLYASLVVQRLVGAPERLRDFPESGRVVPERGERELREIIVRPFRMVYRLGRGSVEIVTVSGVQALPRTQRVARRLTRGCSGPPDAAPHLGV